MKIERDTNGPNNRRRWRIVDTDRKVRTPWQDGEGNAQAIDAATMAVRRTDLNKPTHRHTRDGEWTIVHSL